MAALFNFALRWVFDATIAEELVHDTYIRVWNRRDTVVLQTLKALLYKKVQNLALNEIRNRNKYYELFKKEHPVNKEFDIKN